MAKTVIRYDLLVSCPGDVVSELPLIDKAVEEFNRLFSDALGIIVQTKHWSKNSYFKDKNTNQVEIVPEAAETIHLIFASYLNGMGLKAIARILNEEKRKTPAQMQMALLGKRMPERLEAEIKKKHLWDGTMVGRLLKDEAYTGTLICHKSERNKINKTFRFTEAAEQFRHENYLPPIITREVWEQVQVLLKANAKPYRGNTPSHRIREFELDARVQQYAEEMRSQWTTEQAYLRRIQRLREMKRPATNAHIADLYNEIQRLEQEIDDLLLEKIQSGS